MSLFKDIENMQRTEIQDNAKMSEQELRHYDMGREQWDIENLKDEMNMLRARKMSENSMRETSAESITGGIQRTESDMPMTNEEIDAKLLGLKSELNIKQARYDYMLRSTDTPFRRQIQQDVQQVIYDVAQPTDMGDLASIVRIGSLLANVAMGSSATNTLGQAVKLEGMVTGVETGADLLRDYSEGTQITPDRVFDHATKNLALNLGSFALGKGFKTLVDSSSSRATVEGVANAKTQFDYQETVFDSIDQAKGEMGYAKTTFQTEKGFVDVKDVDAWKTGGALDDAVDMPVVNTVAVKDADGLFKTVTNNEGGVTEKVLTNMNTVADTTTDLSKVMSPQAYENFQYTGKVVLDKPLNSDELVQLAKAMEKDPSLRIDPNVSLKIDARNSNYTMRAINKKRADWISTGRPDLAKQSTRDILGAMRVDATMNRYEIMSPQFRKMIRMVNEGEYHNVAKVSNLGVDERNIVDMVYLDIASLDHHIKNSATELNKTIGLLGGKHGVNNMLDLMEYGDKQGMNLVHMMYDPRYANEGWLRETMTSIHDQLNAVKGMDANNVKEFVAGDDLIVSLDKFGMGDVMQKSPFINAEGVDKYVVGTGMTMEDISKRVNDKGIEMIKQAQKDLDMAFENNVDGMTYLKFLQGGDIKTADLIQMSQKDFKKLVQKKLGKGTKKQIELTREFNKVKGQLWKDQAELKKTLRQVGREYRIATGKLEQISKYMNKQTLMGEGYDILAEYGDGLAKNLKRTPWAEMDDTMKELFNTEIRPDMQRAFKKVDIDANELAHNVDGLDTRTATVKDLWEANPKLKDNLEETAWHLQGAQKQKMGEGLINRYGNISDQDLFNIYIEKYDLPNIEVKYVDGATDFNAQISFRGSTPVGFIVSNENFAKLTRPQQLSTIRHEIEHIIDLQKYGTSGGSRGNIPSLFGNRVRDMGTRGATVKKGQFKLDPRMAMHTGDDAGERMANMLARHDVELNADTNLDMLLRQFYDDHFYNFADDSFENAYVKHTSQYLTNKYQADNLYYEFLNDVKSSTVWEGRQKNMTEIMHKYFDNQTGFEDFMLTHGGGRQVASQNLTTMTRTDGEIRALGSTRPQYIASLSAQNLDKLQKSNLIGQFEGKTAGHGVRVDSDMAHLFKTYGKKLESIWLNDRLTKYAGERFMSDNMATKIVTNMILGNGGIKQTITAPYQMAERMMMGGKIGKGMEEMLRQTGMAVGNYGKLNVYNTANFMESMTKMVGRGDVEGYFAMDLANKMRKFADSTNMKAEGIEDLYQLRKMMKDMYGISAGNSKEGLSKTVDEYFARSLSTQEFYDTYANYTVGKWTVDDFKDIIDADNYEGLTSLQKRILGRGGYLEENWTEGKKALAKYNHADGFDFESAIAESKQVENMYNTGKGYYNRTDKARKLANVSSETRDFRYLMRTTMGLASDSWRETMTMVDGGILTPVKMTSKEGASALAMRAGFLGVSGGGAYTSYKFIRDMERALRTRDTQAINWHRQIQDAEFTMGNAVTKGFDLLNYTGMGLYLADPRGLTSASAIKQQATKIVQGFTTDDANPVDNIFKVSFSVVAGSTMLSRWTMLTGSEAEKESQMQDYFNSGDYNRDVRKNFNKNGMNISKQFLGNYNKSTNAMKTIGK